MTAPTLASYGQTSWNNVSPKTTSITVAVGDILVVKAVGENAVDFAVSTPTGGTGFTWTLKQSYTANNGNCIVYLWTTVATSAQTFTLTLTRTGQNLNYGCAWEVWRDSGGVGTSGKAQASGAPSLALTTGGTDSAISVINGDWNAATGTQTARAVSGLTVTTTGAYPGDGATYGTWSAAYIGSSAAGSKTVGMTAPAGQQYSLLAVEILGTVGGSSVAGSAASTLSAAADATGYRGVGGAAALAASAALVSGGARASGISAGARSVLSGLSANGQVSTASDASTAVTAALSAAGGIGRTEAADAVVLAVTDAVGHVARTSSGATLTSLSLGATGIVSRDLSANASAVSASFSASGARKASADAVGLSATAALDAAGTTSAALTGAADTPEVVTLSAIGHTGTAVPAQDTLAVAGVDASGAVSSSAGSSAVVGVGLVADGTLSGYVVGSADLTVTGGLHAAGGRDPRTQTGVTVSPVVAGLTGAGQLGLVAHGDSAVSVALSSFGTLDSTIGTLRTVVVSLSAGGTVGVSDGNLHDIQFELSGGVVGNALEIRGPAAKKLTVVGPL